MRNGRASRVAVRLGPIFIFLPRLPLPPPSVANQDSGLHAPISRTRSIAEVNTMLYRSIPRHHPLNGQPRQQTLHFIDCHFVAGEDSGPGQQSHSSFGKKQRKARTAFSDDQLRTLETSFDRQKYLSVQDRMELASKLQLTDTQVGWPTAQRRPPTQTSLVFRSRHGTRTEGDWTNNK